MKGNKGKYAKIGQWGNEVVTIFLPTFRILRAPPYPQNGWS